MIRMRHVMLALLSGLATLIFQANAWAVTQTFGAGSAVSVVNGTADFESVGSLFDNPILKDAWRFPAPIFPSTTTAAATLVVWAMSALWVSPATICMVREMVTSR